MKHGLSRNRERNKNISAAARTIQSKNLSSKLQDSPNTTNYEYCGTTPHTFLKSNPGTFWWRISTLQFKKCISNVTLNSESFNNYFKSVFMADITAATSLDIDDALPQVDNIEITESGIMSLLLNSHVKKSRETPFYNYMQNILKIIS